jgi:hypothetical protein
MCARRGCTRVHRQPSACSCLSTCTPLRRRTSPIGHGSCFRWSAAVTSEAFLSVGSAEATARLQAIAEAEATGQAVLASLRRCHERTVDCTSPTQSHKTFTYLAEDDGGNAIARTVTEHSQRIRTLRLPLDPQALALASRASNRLHSRGLPHVASNARAHAPAPRSAGALELRPLLGGEHRVLLPQLPCAPPPQHTHTHTRARAMHARTPCARARSYTRFFLTELIMPTPDTQLRPS